MARDGYRIFDADTHIIEPVEPIEAHLSNAERARLTALGELVKRAPAKAGMSRYRIGRMPSLDRRLGSRERVAPPSRASAARRTAARRGTSAGRARRFRPTGSASTRTRACATWTPRASTST